MQHYAASDWLLLGMIKVRKSGYIQLENLYHDKMMRCMGLDSTTCLVYDTFMSTVNDVSVTSEGYGSWQGSAIKPPSSKLV